MENKINIAELLKDCPNGMELDCTLFEKPVKYLSGTYVITIKTSSGHIFYLTKNGCLHDTDDAKCVIFPKGKTTWEGFVPPCNFKDGDVVVDNFGAIFIYSGIHPHYKGQYADFYCGLTSKLKTFAIKRGEVQRCGEISSLRFATKEEKEKLFKAIKDNGYKWNPETKTLEMLIEPKLKEGKWITIDKPCQIISINDNGNYIVQYCDDEKTHELSKNFCESHFHLWTIKDAKDGDVLVCDINKAEIGGDVEKLPNIVSTIFKYRKVITSKDYIHSYCHLYDRRFLGLQCTMYYNYFVCNIHPATKAQRDLLYQKIKEAGCKWNKEAKTLEKLIEPKFKVWDKIRHKDDETVITITGIKDDYYFIPFYNVRRNDYQNEKVSFKDQDQYELVPNKFDIATLKPFSEVLVRYDNDNPWMTAHFSHYMKDVEWECPYFASGACFKQCIPYKGNEHLRGTTNDCDDFYKTWK